MIDFSASINPLGPSKLALKAIVRGLKWIAHYPDPDCSQLKHKLAGYLGVDERLLVIGNGAVELIYVLMYALRPRKVLVVSPTFSEYARASLAVNAQVKSLPVSAEEGFAIDPARVVQSMEDVDVLFICNPNNPTGTIVSAQAILDILRAASQRGTWVVVDEAFMDFVPHREQYSVKTCVETCKHLVVLGSLTKFFALPGLRVGYGVMPPELVSCVERIRYPWSVNCLAQMACVASLEDTSYMRKSRELIARERDHLRNMLSLLPGVVPLPSVANFLLVDIKGTGLGSTRLAGLLARRGILVRDCSSFEGLGQGYIRVAVLTPKANRTLVKAMRAELASTALTREP